MNGFLTVVEPVPFEVDARIESFAVKEIHLIKVFTIKKVRGRVVLFYHWSAGQVPFRMSLESKVIRVKEVQLTISFRK